MTSRLHTASCFENISSTADADLKQPLVEVQDLESSSSSSYSREEVSTDNARRRLSNHVLVKSLCLGSFVGFLLQAVKFSAYLVITKKWGKNGPLEESGATLSYWTVYLIMHIDIVFYPIIWGGFVTALLTRKGSMYLRKKFDNDADAPNTESVWTERFLFLSGVGFLFGVIVGSYTAWAIVDIELGMPVPLSPLISILFMDGFLCCLMIKCFDWGHQAPEEEDDEDSFFV
jgi:hypothetical protein